MPVAPPGFGVLLARVATCIHYALHPLSTLIHRFLGVGVTGDVDIALWALVAWLLGSREGEAARKAGLVLAAALAAASLLEAALTG